MPTIPDPDDLVPLAWRRRLYDVATAAVPLLAVLGVTTETEALLWLAALGALLGFRTASHYTQPPAP